MKLILGCGYLGSRVAALWQQSGERVAVLTRSPQRAAALEAQGLIPRIADVTDRAALQAALADLSPTTVLYAVGYDRGGGHAMSEVYIEGLQNVLAALPPTTGSLIYVSSTGVYGNFAGDWIDETAPCQPERDGGRVCLAAEQALQAHPLGAISIILRMAGIYGPSRIPRRADLEAGRPLAVPEQGWLNLIHVADAAAIILNVERRGRAGETYLVADGHPVQRGDYFRELARLLSAPPPRFVAAEETPAQDRAASNKRISIAKLQREIEPVFQFPSYREGLGAIVRAP
ncbi:MAG TPA: SDR family oxidoreductase [Pirellulales bacterium]|jgi:nucleoside-diphosphate-sugar epimerase|nr:SDR family oxidoreductase [Pirellulales bacterium]